MAESKRRRASGSVAAVGAVLLTVAAGCSSQSGLGGATTPGGGTLQVFAAASLKTTFTELGKRFGETNPGWKVEFTFAGSSDLVTQLTQGAKADVLASADTRTMDQAAKAGLVDGTPTEFARNTLVIVTAPGNPKQLDSLADLAAPGLATVVCAPQVPCGAATVKVEQSAKVTLAPVSEESSVTDVLNKVTSGQADAGLVYVTDAKVAGPKVAAVPFPEAAAAVNTYPIATLKGSGDAAAARKFVEFVEGPTGTEVLAGAGFATP